MSSSLEIHAPAVNDTFPALPPAPRSALSVAPWLGRALQASLSDSQMRRVLEVSRLLAVPRELQTLLQNIAEICRDAMDCERASIFLHDAVTNELWSKVAIGSGEIRVACAAGIIGHCFTHNELLHVSEPYQDPRFNPVPDRQHGFVTRNLLTCPMPDLTGHPLGALQAVNKRSGDFADADHTMIQLLSEQAGVALQRHHLQLDVLRNLVLKHEMELARTAQQALIPKRPPVFPGVEAVGWTLPASMTGGDCYDLWILRDGRLGILLADASGHGVAPAMTVAQARTLVRALADLEPDPHRLLSRVNARLAEDLDCGQFVTAFLGFMEPDGALRWSSAGHGPVLVRRVTGEEVVLEPPVQPLGIVEDWIGETPPSPVQLSAGDALILVSDGIFEALNPAREVYGVPRMLEVLGNHAGRPAAELLAALREDVRSWHSHCEPEDDQTIVIVRKQ